MTSVTWLILLTSQVPVAQSSRCYVVDGFGCSLRPVNNNENRNKIIVYHSKSDHPRVCINTLLMLILLYINILCLWPRRPLTLQTLTQKRFVISRSSLCLKVIGGSRSRSEKHKACLRVLLGLQPSKALPRNFVIFVRSYIFRMYRSRSNMKVIQEDWVVWRAG